MAQDIQNEGNKARALSGVAEAIFHLDPEGALPIFYEAFKASRYGGRESFFHVLEVASKSIAAIDEGQTLWNVYQEIDKVERWWGESGTTS